MPENRPEQKTKAIIRVSKVLQANTSFAGIPTDQMVPWAIFLFIALGMWSNGVRWQIVFPFLFWSCGTWWLVMGSESWRFLNRFHKPPLWVNGAVRYSPFLKKRRDYKDKGKKS
ncbi:MAG: hypothetical protein AAFZ17_00435 [Cyanobacteria bacterium J06650_10]